MSDLPDYTSPVSISAITIASLPVDIVAQTIGNISIDIAAQTLSTVGIDIKAQTLSQLNVNIAASAITMNVAIQSSAVTLNVNISSQSAFNLNVNIAASAVTLNVAIQSSAVTLNVAIQSSAVTLNVDIVAQTLSQLNVNITASAVTLNVAIQSSAVTLSVDITAQSLANLTINVGDFRSEESPYLQGVAVHSTPTMMPAFTGEEVNKGFGLSGTASLADGVGTVPPNSSIGQKSNIHFGTLLNHKVRWGIAPQSGADRSVGFDNPDWIDFIGFRMLGTQFMAMTKNIEAYETTAVDFPADGATVYHRYDILWRPWQVKFYLDGVLVATHTSGIPESPAGLQWWVNDSITGNLQTIAGMELEQDREAASILMAKTNVNINIAAQSVGNVAIDIAAQTLGNIAVNIAAQTVDLNIKTSGGANIVIDQLTQSAFVERGSDLTNQGETPIMQDGNLTLRRGKFFPRGARGFIEIVGIYCDNLDTNPHTFTVRLSPMPGMGPVVEYTFVLPGQTAASENQYNLYRMWNYDSMFIQVRSDSDTYGRLAVDTGEPHDGYSSSDWATWVKGSWRFWFSAYMWGQTVGDLPVSGTLNTIEIPSVVAARRAILLQNIGAGMEGYDTLQAGAGELLFALFMVIGTNERDNLFPRIRVDGVQAMPYDDDFSRWNSYLISAYTPGVTIAKWDQVNNIYTIVVTLNIPFKRSLEVGYYNDGIVAYDGEVSYVYKKIA